MSLRRSIACMLCAGLCGCGVGPSVRYYKTSDRAPAPDWVVVPDDAPEDDRDEGTDPFDVRRPSHSNVTSTRDCAARMTAGRDFEPIYFDPDTHYLDWAARRRLTNYADWLRTHPRVWVTLVGHCGASGSVRFDFCLAMTRAVEVQDFLAGHGVPADRLFPISYGEERTTSPSLDRVTMPDRVELFGFVAPPSADAPASPDVAPQLIPNPQPPTHWPEGIEEMP